jgi:glycosyltransferase involved in cell wall biosynthesis
LNRVAIYLISDGMGGAEQVVWQTIYGLRKCGSIYLIVNQEIASFYTDLLPEFKILNIGNIYVHLKNKSKVLKVLLNNRYYSLIPWFIRFKSGKVVDYLIKNDINTIHSHLDYALFSSLLIKKFIPNTKVIHTVHGAFGLLDDKLLKPSLALSRIRFAQVNKLIFVSNYNYNMYKERGIPINEYEIIYNGIDFSGTTNFWRPIKSNKLFEILYVGGIKYVKGFDILVETIDLLSKSNFSNNFYVVILGPLTHNCELVDLIKQRGLGKYFKLVGFVPPPFHLTYFKSADILFMPSRSEALPIAAIEAISLDLPVIASKIGGLPEILKHGENGLLCKNNPEEFNDLFLNLFVSYDTFLDKVKDYNLKNKYQFDARNMCKKLCEIY